jgi:cell division transport system ATP-binding protein
VVLQLQRVAVRPPGGAWSCGVLSLILAAGGAHIVTGEAGSGKSALLEMVAMARTPARGGAELFGENLAAVKPGDRYRLRRRIGMIHQDPQLLDEHTVYDNLAIAVRAAGRSPENLGSDIDEALAWVGLRRRGGAMGGTLDAEGRRRLAIARAVINRPDLIIADEPCADGDLSRLRLLADVNRAGTALLIATRDAELAGRCGSDVSWLTSPSAAPLDSRALETAL